MKIAPLSADEAQVVGTRTVTPVILCGGSGTRLWPVSRRSYPKQFAPLMGEQSLFQASAQRLRGASSGIAFAAPMVMTTGDFRFIVTEQLAAAGVDPGAILIEPDMRNTASSVLAATLQVLRTDPDAVLLVAPSDHVILDDHAFRAAVARGLQAVDAGQMVTFGVVATRPETGFGYLELAAPVTGALPSR